jgi:hypothetical protein
MRREAAGGAATCASACEQAGAASLQGLSGVEHSSRASGSGGRAPRLPLRACLVAFRLDRASRPGPLSAVPPRCAHAGCARARALCSARGAVAVRRHARRFAGVTPWGRQLSMGVISMSGSAALPPRRAGAACAQRSPTPHCGVGHRTARARTHAGWRGGGPRSPPTGAAPGRRGRRASASAGAHAAARSPGAAWPGNDRRATHVLEVRIGRAAVLPPRVTGAAGGRPPRRRGDAHASASARDCCVMHPQLRAAGVARALRAWRAARARSAAALTRRRGPAARCAAAPSGRPTAGLRRRGAASAWWPTGRRTAGATCPRPTRPARRAPPIPPRRTPRLRMAAGRHPRPRRTPSAPPEGEAEGE